MDDVVFIEDKEFDLSDETNEDLLGTRPYAETLFEVVKKSNGNQNIGLFGGWGSGKSTIIKTLERYIANHSRKSKKEKIAFFKYDAWKYSNDDFRRSFIKSLNNQFNIIKRDDLSEVLYKETTVQDDKKSKVRINKWLIISFFISVALIIFTGEFILPNIETEYLRVLFSTLSITPLFVELFKNFFRITPVTVRQSKMIEAERFEETFQLILHKILGGDNNWFSKFNEYIFSKHNFKKIVIVIDNLDRCDNNSLKETLVTMKNFLENENVIFILPVDENGITSFLNADTEDSEEYLRKIFHQIIRVKKFTPKELDSFTNTLNQKYKLGLTKTGIRLICQEFTTNPRKIIQFLNNLQTERDLIKRQIKEGYINLDYTEQADDFLIKLLIVKQEWNIIYKKILDDVNYLNKVNKGLRGQIQQKKNNFILNISGQEIELTRDQKRFFKRNINVHFNNVEPFILNIDRDKDVPDELRYYIENGELEGVLSLLSINEEDSLNDSNAKLLLQQIESIYDYNTNKFEDYISIALPISELLFDLMNYENVAKEIKNNLKDYTFIRKIFEDGRFGELIKNINNFEKYCNATKWFYEEIEYKIPVEKLTNHLNSLIRPDITDEGIHEKILVFLETFKNQISLISKLKKNLNGKLLSDTSLLQGYKIFENNIEVSKTIIDNDFIDKAIEMLNQDKISEKKIIKTITSITDKYIENDYLNDELILTKYANYYIKELKSQFNIKRTTPKGIFELKNIVDYLNKLIPKSDFDTIETDITIFDDILQELNNNYNSSLNQSEINFYISFLQMIINYMHKENGDFSTENFDKYFNEFFKKNDFVDLSLGINKIYQQEINHYGAYDWNFFNLILEKLTNFKKLAFVDTLMLMLSKSTDDKGLKAIQKVQIGQKLIELFIYYNNRNQDILKMISPYFSKFMVNNRASLIKAIDALSPDTLEKYVYNVHKLNEKFVLNSFSKYLSNESNYMRFKKFIRFIQQTHSEEVQNNLFTEIFNWKKYVPFDWLFLSKEHISKKNYNNLIINYVERYSDNYKNDYLNKLLPLKKSELYKKTIDNIINLIDKIENPTKKHKDKISSIRNNLKK